MASATPLGPDTLDRLRRISTPTLTTQLFKLGFRNTFLAGVRPLCPDKRVAGPSGVADAKAHPPGRRAVMPDHDESLGRSYLMYGGAGTQAFSPSRPHVRIPS